MRRDTQYSALKLLPFIHIIHWRGAARKTTVNENLRERRDLEYLIQSVVRVWYMRTERWVHTQAINITLYDYRKVPDQNKLSGSR